MFRSFVFRSLLVTGVIVIGVVLAAPSSAMAQSESEQRIQQLEDEVGDLKALLEEMRNSDISDERLDEIERRIEILAEEVENLRVGDEVLTATPDETVPGLGPAASKVYRKESGLSIGGYGEMLFTSFDSEKDDGSEAGKTDNFDFLRAVFYVGYKFNDRFVLNSELEFEHASTSEDGSVSVEFAYVDYLHSDGFNVRAGLVLLPMGFLNELHEPTVYLGTTRPETERRIIPSTWRENGFGVHGDVGGFTYRTYIVNGLDASGFSASGLRGGRQKGSKAKAEDLAWVGRFDWIGMPGLMAGGSMYAGDSGQDLMTADGRSVSVPTLIYEGHVDYRIRGLELRGLYARADLGDVAELNEALGLQGSASVGETMVGYYLQVGYDVFAGRGGRSSLTPYVRWENLNTQDSVPSGWTTNPATDQRILSVGLGYQPIQQLIVKVDYQDIDNGADTGIDQINLNLGYIF